jgi:uncharacterized protein
MITGLLTTSLGASSFELVVRAYNSTCMDYDPRYLIGVLLFNQQDYFEAHEAWEDLWSESHGPERRFYQGMIQAAVGLCHFANGNVRGARKLYTTSLGYLDGLPPHLMGLDLEEFRREMEACFKPLLAADAETAKPELSGDYLPTLMLDPPPETWPDPTPFLESEH